MQNNANRKFVELEWVCPNCNGRNRGSVKTCQSCGAPQPANVKFQRAADEKVVTDEKSVAAAAAGADIHCGFCGTRNPATATHCSQCGGDLKEGKARQAGGLLQAAPVLKNIICDNCGTENSGNARTCMKCGAPLKVQVPPAPTPTGPRPVPASKAAIPGSAPAKKTNWWIFAGIGGLLLVCCVAIIMLFVVPSKSVKGTVTSLRWETSVPVQEIQPVNHSNERGSAPSGAYNVSCHTEDKEVCQDKTVDQGNGFAEVVKDCHTESEQFCDYTVDEWKTIQTYTLNGNDNSPKYEDPTITGNQRTGSPSETLTVTFSIPDGQKSYSPGSVSEFQQFQTGSVWTLKLNALGGVVSVER